MRQRERIWRKRGRPREKESSRNRVRKPPLGGERGGGRIERPSAGAHLLSVERRTSSYRLSVAFLPLSSSIAKTNSASIVTILLWFKIFFFSNLQFSNFPVCDGSHFPLMIPHKRVGERFGEPEDREGRPNTSNSARLLLVNDRESDSTCCNCT